MAAAAMNFNHFLSTHLLNADYRPRRLYEDMIEQAVLADKLGYRGVSIPEHHLINILMLPSPLQMAVKLSNLTKRLELVTSVLVLPVHDMRVLAGEIIQADILCDQRLILGVGRGAFPYELAHMGAPVKETARKFTESLAVLETLLAREEVSWKGEFYDFGPITIMPRPERKLPIMIAAMSPEGIYHSAKKGYSIQTTPLSGTHDALLAQTGAFHKAKQEAGEDGHHLRLALQRGVYLARSEADAADKIGFAYEYFKRFDNVYSGPGLVSKGIIAPLNRNQTREELARNLLICTKNEMLDRLSMYRDAGIDEIILSSNYGQPQEDTLDMMHRFAEEIMPHFSGRKPA
jgi:alkanesulfonate monooxygenase SsuD/methylene tetrahydromethanopterin reductase-like flavin-dependent oxidoreductase (luciferase family)